MARTLREVIAAVPAERRAKIAAAHRQKIVAEEQKLIVVARKRQLQETKRVMELDSNLIAIAAIITALPIVAALAWMLLPPSLWATGRTSFGRLVRSQFAGQQSSATHVRFGSKADIGVS